MAQARKTTSSTNRNTNSRSTSRSGSSSNKRTSAASPRQQTGSASRSSANTSAHRKKTTKQQPSARSKDDIVEVGIGDYWHAFTKTKVFVPVMTILVTAVLVGIDLLIAWNTYQRFFVLLGIELIIAAAAWLFIMIYSIGSSKKTSADKKDGV